MFDFFIRLFLVPILEIMDTLYWLHEQEHWPRALRWGLAFALLGGFAAVILLLWLVS